WAWVEDDPEVMGDAADLGVQVGLPAVAFAAGADPELLAAAGAEHVYVWQQPYDAESGAEAMLGCLREPPAAVLLPGPPRGSAPRSRALGRRPWSGRRWRGGWAGGRGRGCRLRGRRVGARGPGARGGRRARRQQCAGRPGLGGVRPPDGGDGAGGRPRPLPR